MQKEFTPKEHAVVQEYFYLKKTCGKANMRKLSWKFDCSYKRCSELKNIIEFEQTRLWWKKTVR